MTLRHVVGVGIIPVRHEAFLRYTPSQGRRGEIAPARAGRVTAGTVGAEAGRQQVPVHQGIVDAAQVRHQHPFRVAGRRRVGGARRGEVVRQLRVAQERVAGGGDRLPDRTVHGRTSARRIGLPLYSGRTGVMPIADTRRLRL